MSRFDTQKDARQTAPPENGGAADSPLDPEHLLSGIEPEVKEVIDTAVARVAEIERIAVREARQLIRRSEQEARGAYGAALDRSSELVRRLEVLAGTVTELSSALRTEVDDVVESLRDVREEDPGWPVQGRSAQASQDPVAAPEPEPPPPKAEPPESSAPEPSQVSEPGPSAPDPEVEPSPELTELFREQITNMRREGKPYEDAERVLLRFKLGHRFLGMLDEIYSSDLPSSDVHKPGLMAKLRSRS